MTHEQPIIVGLDIGTTKIAAIAGRKNEYGKLEILGFGRANSNGVKHGQVLNIDETIKAIKMALDNCYASNPNLNVTEVYVGIAGHQVRHDRGVDHAQALDAANSELLIDHGQRVVAHPAGRGRMIDRTAALPGVSQQIGIGRDLRSGIVLVDHKRL